MCTSAQGLGGVRHCPPTSVEVTKLGSFSISTIINKILLVKCLNGGQTHPSPLEMFLLLIIIIIIIIIIITTTTAVVIIVADFAHFERLL